MLEQLKGFRAEDMVAATLVFEGTKSEVSRQRSEVYSIAAKYGGVRAGADNGRRGDAMTYMIGTLAPGVT